MAGHGVECGIFQGIRGRYVGVDVNDGEWPGPFDGMGLLNKVFRQIDTGYMSAAPRDLPGDAAVPAGDVQHAQAADRAEQVEQRAGDGIVGGIEPGCVEVGDGVIPGLGHAAQCAPRVGAFTGLSAEGGATGRRCVR